MATTSRTAAVLLATVTVLMVSCTRYVDDARAVAGPDRSPVTASDASQCEEVDAPLTTIPVAADGEPVLKIPQPPGWERSTMLDSELIRFAMLNENLADETFTPNVVVTLESAPGIEQPEVVFDSQRQALESVFGATGLRVIERTLCGLPAETLHYQTPVLGNIPAHPAIAVLGVLHTDNMTYAVSVTVQTTDPENPVYKHDAEEILTGFQLLPPSPN